VAEAVEEQRLRLGATNAARKCGCVHAFVDALRATSDHDTRFTASYKGPMRHTYLTLPFYLA
jgi:hypothetical protein